MSYSLCFAPEFFWGDESVPRMKPGNRPISVCQALIGLPDNQWAALARDLFGIEPCKLEPDMVMQRIMETNTCRNLDSPVEVFIDRQGFYSILVYEKEEPCA